MPHIINLRERPAAGSQGMPSGPEPLPSPQDEFVKPEGWNPSIRQPSRRTKRERVETAPPPPELLDRAPTFLAWETPTAEPKLLIANALVYIGAVLIAGGFVAFALANFLFALFLFLAGGLVISYQFRAPHPVRIAITSRGVQVGRRIYEFEGLDSFWIFYDPPLVKELSILSKKTFIPPLRLPLGDLDPVLVRETLLGFLRERQQDRSVIDIVSRGLGF